MAAPKKYSIIHAPLMSFFSMDFYRDVGLNWKRVGFGYLLLLLAICWIPSMLRVHWAFSHFVEYEAPGLVEQIPEITIADGEASIKEPQPYYITDPDSNEVFAVIDTTGSLKSLADTDAVLLMTKTEVFMRKSEYETQGVDLREVESFSVSGDQIMGWLRSFNKVDLVVIYPFALGGSYVYRIIQALIYGAIGLAFASACRVKLPYDALLRLSVMAVTPCIIVGVVMTLTMFRLPVFLYLVGAMTYLYFGVRACAEMSVATEDIHEVEPADFEDYDAGGDPGER